jgi:peptidoglycan/LPS O-acetylase OafA/YrhL
VSAHRIASLDLLRGAAALCVAIPHFFMYQHVGEKLAETISILGVEIFFVLSGYVLAPQIVLVVVERPDVRNLLTFWARRWMRTIPAYLIALILMSVVARELWSADFFRYALYVQNFARQSNASDYFAIAWSLSIEEWFYLLFPPFVIVVATFVRQRAMRPIVAGVCFILLISALRSLFGDNMHWGSEVRRVVIYRMDAIGWGFVLNLAITRSNMLRRISARIAWALFAAIATLSIFLTLMLAHNSSPLIEVAFPLYAAAFGASSIVLALASNAAFERHATLSTVAEFLGRISYSTYLFHLLVLSALADHLTTLPWPLLLTLYLVVTGAVATLTYISVEAPILAKRPDYQRRAHLPLGQ